MTPSFQLDIRDAAVLSASGFTYVFAFFTSSMNPMVAAAIIGFLGVALRVGFDFYKLRRDNSKIISERDHYKNEYNKLLEADKTKS